MNYFENSSQHFLYSIQDRGWVYIYCIEGRQCKLGSVYSCFVGFLRYSSLRWDLHLLCRYRFHYDNHSTYGSHVSSNTHDYVPTYFVGVPNFYRGHYSVRWDSRPHDTLLSCGHWSSIRRVCNMIRVSVVSCGPSI